MLLQFYDKFEYKNMNVRPSSPVGSITTFQCLFVQVNRTVGLGLLRFAGSLRYPPSYDQLLEETEN